MAKKDNKMFSTKILGMFLILMRIRGIMSQSFSYDEGPYKTVISNVTRCAPPIDWFQWNMTTYPNKGHNLLRGTFNYTRSMKEVKVRRLFNRGRPRFRIIVYYLGERKTKVFDMKNQNCHNTIVEVILKMVALPFNHQTCRMKAGSYGFKDFNMDAIFHTVVQSLWYGAAQLSVEVNERKATVMCLGIDFHIKKLQ